MKINMKKIISFFLVFTILASLSLGAFAATNTNSAAKNDEYENMRGLLETLGIIQDYDNFSETKVITRGFFAMVAARLYNMPFDGVAKEQRFADVPIFSSYADPIEVLVTRGIINGDGTGAFHENDRIKTIDAIKMLVLIADYGFMAEANGGYPDGYIKAASTAGILKGVGGLYDYVSYESLLVLISNFLNAYVVERTVTTGDIKYTISEDEILLNTLFLVKEVEGVVTKNEYTAFFSASDLIEDHIEVTSEGIKYVFYSETAEDFIGEKVKAYYSNEYTKNGYEDVLVYIHPATKGNKNLQLNIEDVNLALSTQNEIKYYVEGNKKLKDADCVESPTVIYNQMAYAEGTFDFEAVLGDKTGTIELIDNTGDGRYEIIKITAYKSFVIGNILLDQLKVYSRWDAYGINTDTKNPDIININPEDFDKFSMKYEDGTTAEALDLIESHVISAAESSPNAGRKITDIIISRNIQSGKITSIDYERSSGDKCYITLDSQRKLKTNESIITNFELSLNKPVTLYIDAFENVVGAGNIATGNFRYGIMLDSYKERKKIQVKLFTAENNVQNFTLTEKVYIDGVKYTSAESAWSRLEEVKAAQKDGFESSVGYQLAEGVYPIKYMLNDEGLVYKIDTPTDDKDSSEDNGLIEGVQGEFYTLYDYILIKPSESKTVPFTKETTVIWFSLPDYQKTDKYEDDGALEVSTASSLASSFSKYSLVTYRLKNALDADYPYADLVLIFEEPGVSIDSSMFVVDNVSAGVVEATGDVLPRLSGIYQGGNKTVFVSPDFVEEFNSLNLGKGDTVRVSMSGFTGYLVDADLISHYEVSTDVESANYGNLVAMVSDPIGVLPTKINSTNQKRWFYSGYVAERRGELIKLKYKGAGEHSLVPDADEMSDETNMLYCHPTASTTVVVYDKSEERVFSGSFDDIQDYISTGEAASRVIVRYDSGSLKEIVVYND